MTASPSMHGARGRVMSQLVSCMELKAMNLFLSRRGSVTVGAGGSTKMPGWQDEGTERAPQTQTCFL